MDKPLIIIDQMDKLKDAQMDLFMDFYNDLSGHCGFVLSGVPALKKRVLSGVNRDKIGYAELWSRVGRKFIELDKTSKKDVQLICEANGVKDAMVISEAYNACGGDLRTVRRHIEHYFLTRVS
jgi:DNA transposition AAA+ family ATPase